MKLTLGDVRSTIAKMLSMQSTDSRVVKYVNEAQERLLYKGKWPSSYARYAVTNSNGTITWPRQLETVEAAAVNTTPAVIRNDWFEFLETGWGLMDADGHDDLTLIDRGTACTFSDIDTDGDKKIRVYYNSADNGKKITIQGYDKDGYWIRESDGTSVQDGEVLTFDTSSDTADSTVNNATHYALTTNTFSIVSAVHRDETVYGIRLYEVEATGTVTARMIADYEPTETRPIYRRSLISGLAESGSTDSVTVVGKLRFVPASVDSDWLMINYEAALKEMVMSIRKAENNLAQEADYYEGRAVRLMQEQLEHYVGDGTVMVPKFQNPATYGGGGVANLI